MTQAQLDRAVSRATGETVEFVRQAGFSEMRLPTTSDWTRKMARIAARSRRLYRPHGQKRQPMRQAA
jgi:hypothetical protein